MPTPRFWACVAAGIPAAAVAFAYGVPLLWVAYNALLLGAAWMTMRLAPGPEAFRLRRKHDPVLSVGVRNHIQATLTNDGVVPVAGRMRDEAPEAFGVEGNESDFRLAPGTETVVHYMVRPPRRGTSAFRGTFLRLDCPLGLVQKEVFLPAEGDVRVYPNVLALREFDLLNQKGRLREIGIRRSRIRGLGTEFESLREYTEGDDYRKIDWKATARRGKPIVRQFELERNQCVLLVVDIGRRMLSEVEGRTKLDRVLDALVMVAHSAVAAGDMVGVLVYGDRVRRWLPPRKGQAQLTRVLEALHDLAAEPVESDPVAAFAYLGTKWNRRSLLMCFTESDDPDSARKLAASFGPMARRHYALLARIQDPRLRQSLQVPLSDVPTLYERGAASFLDTGRREAGSILERSNVFVLDSDPETLAADLVNCYFRVKERALI